MQNAENFIGKLKQNVYILDNYANSCFACFNFVQILELCFWSH
jgi:hypothetical protein